MLISVCVIPVTRKKESENNEEIVINKNIILQTLVKRCRFNNFWGKSKKS